MVPGASQQELESDVRALTDVSERRLQIWHRTLNPKTYEVRDSGDTWAVAKESSSGSPFWVLCRYDWSDPDVVRWTITQSSSGGGRASHPYHPEAGAAAMSWPSGTTPVPGGRPSPCCS